MSNLQSQLIMSQLPYPKYYDGLTWNTIINKNRKNIPAYLIEDLPPLKFQQLREEFKSMNSIECPRLTFFKQSIAKKIIKCHHEDEHGNGASGNGSSGNIMNTTNTRNSIGYQKKLEKKKLQELKTIREELKYALITSDKTSNVIRGLVERANRIEQEMRVGSKRKRERAVSLKIIESRQGCFENTLDIVLHARKELLRKVKPNSRGKSREKDTLRIFNQLNQIQLLPYSEEQQQQ